MNIIGVSCYFHDSAVALVRDDIVIAAAQEERFTRKKHDNGFPHKSLEYVLSEGGISIDKIDAVAFYEKPILKFERAMQSFVHTFPFSAKPFIDAMPTWFTEKLQIRKKLRELGYPGKVYFIEHHLAHAASAFLCSPFSSAAVLTVDGVGEWATTAIGYGHENKVQIDQQINFPHSLGLLYSAFTAFLGFKINNDEYKVMGLASYGNPDKYYEKIRRIITTYPDASYSLDMGYFDHDKGTRSYSDKMIKEFGQPRKPESGLTQDHIDIAAALQKITEELLIDLAKYATQKYSTKNLCMAGGVALNCVANARIINEAGINLFVQPAAGDDGTALGCALYVYNTLQNNSRKFIMEHAYYGPRFTDEQVYNYLDSRNVVYKKINYKEVPKQTARLIKKGNIVGWFQGRMEWGPRALGSRSILADPTNPRMKDILNDRVKHREDFRPFAPVSTIEDAKKYFEMKQLDPFMILLCNVKKNWRKKLPSITHVDGTARLQTISKEYNLLYHDAIKQFQKLSGAAVLINTSYNIRGEPIVCTPHDAFRCMMGTGIDVLVMHNAVIWKKDNLGTAWDSSSLAKGG